MKRLTTLAIFVILLSSTGCVTTKEYQARVADIEGLKNEKGALEQKLKQTEDEKAALESQVAKLSQELEALKKQNQTLADENANLDKLLKAGKSELGAKISELRYKLTEKESELAAKNAELEDLRKQLGALAGEKEALIAEREKGQKELVQKSDEIEELRKQAVAMAAEREALSREKEKSVAELKKTYDSLVKEMNDEVKKGEITITQLKDKLTVNMVEKILFDSGSAEIKKEGKKVLERVAEILRKVSDKQVRVEGHTDNVRIGPRIAAKFPTNWELSAVRATTVARYLQDRGIDPKLLSACAYSEYRPFIANDTEEGKAKNRRIEITLIPKESSQAAVSSQTKN